jgi:diaminohydroxyphosphoribosylaminopyrimidine deaminase / 5-amino-6-(5-phosphoribosylamino)uracil reductase
VQRLRHSSDAVLTGIGTVLADDPLLTDRSGLPRRRPLLRVILDSQLRLPLDSRLVRSAAEKQQNDVLILCSEDAPGERESALRSLGVQVHEIPLRNGHLDLRVALDVLDQHHIRSVLVEAGSILNGSLLRAHLADKVVLYFSERELGLAALPFAQGAESPYTLQERLSSLTRTSFPHNGSEDVRITGYLDDPWVGV